MPFVVAGKPVPERTIEKGNKLNKLFLVLNSLFPFLLLINSVFQVTLAKDFKELRKVLNISSSILFAANGILQIISGVYLGKAVNDIRKFINSGNG
jgi:hypothetical protein